nr:uncharacterized protein LOC129266285 [Lytechinus pictus]XP_054760096.1 uncharacterized protein LOC129266285 [Lytechinus pictus]
MTNPDTALEQWTTQGQTFMLKWEVDEDMTNPETAQEQWSTQGQTFTIKREVDEDMTNPDTAQDQWNTQGKIHWYFGSSYGREGGGAQARLEILIVDLTIASKIACRLSGTYYTKLYVI